MAARDRRFVIVGGGLAGAKAVETLREEGFDGAITLIAEEADRPYERPPLSKEYLRGEAEDRPYVHPEDFYSENDIEVRLGSEATAIDGDAAEVVIDDGERVGYDRLLLATGAEPRGIDVPGSDLDGIFHLRTIADSGRSSVSSISTSTASTGRSSSLRRPRHLE